MTNKTTLKRLKLDPYFSKTIETNLNVWSHDQNSYEIKFEFYDHQCNKPIDLTGADMRILLDHADSKPKIYPLEVESKVLGLAKFIMPKEIRGCEGKFTAHIYADYPNRTHDFGSFTFYTQLSKIDKSMDDCLDTVYVSEFEKALEKFKEIEDKIEKNNIVTKTELEEYTHKKEYIDTSFTTLENSLNENVNNFNQDITNLKNNKADKKETNDKLNAKADKSYVDGKLDSKADKEPTNQKLSELESSKADKTYVEDALSNVGNMRPQEIFATYEELVRKYPSGTKGIMLVKSNNHWYFWSKESNKWVDGGFYGVQDVMDGTVTPTKTDFVTSTEVLSDESKKKSNTFWLVKDEQIQIREAQGLETFERITLHAGKTYSVINCRGIFSGLTDTSGKLIRQFSQADNLDSFEVSASGDRYLHVTRRVQDPKTIVVDKPLNVASKLDVNKLKLGYNNTIVDGLELSSDQIEDGSVTPEKTTFVKEVSQLVDRDSINEGSYWLFSGGKAELKKSDGWKTFDRIKLKAGFHYSFFNVKGLFSGIVDDSYSVIKQFATSDVLGDYEYYATKDAYAVLSMSATYPTVINEKKEYISADMVDAPFGKIKTNYDGLENVSMTTKIHVKKDGTKDFVKLIDAVEHAKKATKQNVHEIMLHDSVYDLFAEFGGKSYIDDVTQNPNKYGEKAGLVLPDYVNLTGIGRVRVEFTTPDAMATEESCKRISTLNAFKNNVISNIDFVAKNARYTIHPESGNNFHNQKLIFNDCSFEHLGNKAGVWQNTTAVACGTGSNGFYEFNRCDFRGNIAKNSAAFSMHDNSNQKSNIIIFNDCKLHSKGDDTIRFGTWGKNSEVHKVYFNHCDINGRIRLKEESSGSGDGNRFKVYGSGNSQVPYYTTNSIGEPLKIEFSDEVVYLRNESKNGFKKGTPVRYSSSTGFQPIGSGQKFLYCGILLEDCASGDECLVKKDGFIHIDDTKLEKLPPLTKLYIDNGELTVTPSDNIVAVALDPENIKMTRTF